MNRNIHPFEKRQTMVSPTYEIHHYKDSYLQDIALHHHDFYEIYFFLSGQVTYLIESRAYELMPGDILLISPLELHHPQFAPNNVDRPYERIVLWIEKSYLEKLSSPESDLASCFDISPQNHSNLLRLSPEVRESMEQLLEALIEESYHKDFASDLAAETILSQLLIRLNRQVLKGEYEFHPAGRSEQIISDVLQYINHHLDSDISLDLLSARFFISKYHLSREFHRLVGTSVYRYVIQKRLLTAKQKMLEGETPTNVYVSCGFGDYTNFYRAFKAEYGISPKNFIKKSRKE